MFLKWFYVKGSMPVVAKGAIERQPVVGRWPTPPSGDTDPALSPQLQEEGAVGGAERRTVLSHSLPPCEVLQQVKN